MPPPSAAIRCITGFYEGRYVEVKLHPQDFWQHWRMDNDLGRLPWMNSQEAGGGQRHIALAANYLVT